MCSCRDGFLLRGDNRTCDDINECSVATCAHTCVNLAGGFRCECDVGYVLDEDGVSCNGMFDLRELEAFYFINSTH